MDGTHILRENPFCHPNINGKLKRMMYKQNKIKQVILDTQHFILSAHHFFSIIIIPQIDGEVLRTLRIKLG